MLKNPQFSDFGTTNFFAFLHFQAAFREFFRKGPADAMPLIVFSEHNPCYSLKPREYENAKEYFRAPLIRIDPEVFVAAGDDLIPVRIVPLKIKGGMACYHGPGVLGVYIIGKFFSGPREFLLILSEIFEKTLNDCGLKPARITNPYDLWVSGKKVAAFGIISSYLPDGSILTGGGANIHYGANQKHLEAIWPCGDRAGIAGSIREFVPGITRKWLVDNLKNNLTEGLKFLIK